MGMLDSFLGNETVQRLAFGQLKGLFAEKNLDFILVKLDAQGEIELEMYRRGEGIVVPIPEGLTGEQVLKGVSNYPFRNDPERLTLKPNGKKKGGKHA